jgi:D-glycero-D-manno-heptose 1,7-bisphosphate phosphatase
VRPRHLILDRDGVLNEEAPASGYIRRPEDWRWIPGALEALALLARAGYRLSIATNQSGVGRGLMTAQDLEAVHARMTREASDAGARIDAVFACMHAPDDGCDCRKPAPGLIVAAVSASGMPGSAALVVGDDRRDIEAARNAGVPAVLLRTGKGRHSAAALSREGVPVYDDLHALARTLMADRAAEESD